MVKNDLTIAGVSLSYIVIVFVWAVYMLEKNRPNLDKEKVKEKMGKMYLDIIHFDTAGLFYFPYILMRSFIFIMIGTLLVFTDIFAIMFLMLFNTFCYIWYFQYEPHSRIIRRIQEGCNESFTMIAAYHLMTFSNWVGPTQQFYAGY